MATGIPRKNGSSKSKPVELAYPGKKSTSIILNHLGHSGFNCMRHCSSGNRLYCGGNLNGLRELLADSSSRGKVTLVYIDPPFVMKSSKANKAFDQPSLFDTLDDAAQAPPSHPVSSHTPITDFSVYVQKDVFTEIHSIVEKWMWRNNLSGGVEQTNTLAVSESVNIAEVCYQLHACDKKLARIIDAVGPYALNCRHAGFNFLVDTIVSQELSKKVADTI